MRCDLLRLVSLGAFVAAAFSWAGCSHDWDPVDPGTSSGGTAAGGGGSGGAPGGGGAGGSGGAGLPNGEACTAPAECASASCVDGLCCNSVCDRDCEACSVASFEGSCTSYTAGSDPDGLCQGGTCDGVGDCAVGGHLWSAGYGSAADLQRVSQVALDGTGNMVVAGTFEGAINFGGPGDELTSAGGEDVFVAKLAPDGTHLWSQRYGDSAEQGGDDMAVAVDWRGAIVIVGGFAGSMDIAGQSLNSAGGQDVYLAKLSSDGTGLWAQSFGDGDEQLGTSLAVGSDRGIALTGGYAGAVDLGGGSLPSQSAQGAFIARFAQ